MPLPDPRRQDNVLGVLHRKLAAGCLDFYLKPVKTARRELTYVAGRQFRILQLHRSQLVEQLALRRLPSVAMRPDEALIGQRIQCFVFFRLRGLACCVLAATQ